MANFQQPPYIPHPARWQDRPDYIAACNTAILANGPHQYLVPRRIGSQSPTDVTDFHPGQWNWHLGNLPGIMYELYPSNNHIWKEFKSSAKPPAKLDHQGNIMLERWPRPGHAPRALLDYRILPDQIGSEEEPWYIDVVRRLDPRITWDDILMRMEMTPLRSSFQDDKTYKNTCHNNNATRNFRPDFSVLCWHNKNSNDGREQEILGRLTPAQIQANTTRGTTPGIINPGLPDTPQNRVPMPDPSKRRGARNTPRMAQISRNGKEPAHESEDSGSEIAESSAMAQQRPRRRHRHRHDRTDAGVKKSKKNRKNERSDVGGVNIYDPRAQHMYAPGFQQGGPTGYPVANYPGQGYVPPPPQQQPWYNQGGPQYMQPGNGYGQQNPGFQQPTQQLQPQYQQPRMEQPQNDIPPGHMLVFVGPEYADPRFPNLPLGLAVIPVSANGPNVDLGETFSVGQPGASGSGQLQDSAMANQYYDGTNGPNVDQPALDESNQLGPGTFDEDEFQPNDNNGFDPQDLAFGNPTAAMGHQNVINPAFTNVTRTAPEGTGQQGNNGRTGASEQTTQPARGQSGQTRKRRRSDDGGDNEDDRRKIQRLDGQTNRDLTNTGGPNTMNHPNPPMPSNNRQQQQRPPLPPPQTQGSGSGNQTGNRATTPTALTPQNQIGNYPPASQAPESATITPSTTRPPPRTAAYGNPPAAPTNTMNAAYQHPGNNMWQPTQQMRHPQYFQNPAMPANMGGAWYPQQHGHQGQYPQQPLQRMPQFTNGVPANGHAPGFTPHGHPGNYPGSGSSSYTSSRSSSPSLQPVRNARGDRRTRGGRGHRGADNSRAQRQPREPREPLSPGVNNATAPTGQALPGEQPLSSAPTSAPAPVTTAPELQPPATSEDLFAELEPQVYSQDDFAGWDFTKNALENLQPESQGQVTVHPSTDPASAPQRLPPSADAGQEAGQGRSLNEDELGILARSLEAEDWAREVLLSDDAEKQRRMIQESVVAARSQDHGNASPADGNAVAASGQTQPAGDPAEATSTAEANGRPNQESSKKRGRDEIDDAGSNNEPATSKSADEPSTKKPKTDHLPAVESEKTTEVATTAPKASETQAESADNQASSSRSNAQLQAPSPAGAGSSTSENALKRHRDTDNETDADADGSTDDDAHLSKKQKQATTLQSPSKKGSDKPSSDQRPGSPDASGAPAAAEAMTTATAVGRTETSAVVGAPMNSSFNLPSPRPDATQDAATLPAPASAQSHAPALATADTAFVGESDHAQDSNLAPVAPSTGTDWGSLIDQIDPNLLADIDWDEALRNDAESHRRNWDALRNDPVPDDIDWDQYYEENVPDNPIDNVPIDNEIIRRVWSDSDEDEDENQHPPEA